MSKLVRIYTVSDTISLPAFIHYTSDKNLCITAQNPGYLFTRITHRPSLCPVIPPPGASDGTHASKSVPATCTSNPSRTQPTMSRVLS